MGDWDLHHRGTEDTEPISIVRLPGEGGNRKHAQRPRAVLGLADGSKCRRGRSVETKIGCDFRFRISDLADCVMEWCDPTYSHTDRPTNSFLPPPSTHAP
jgi:hypothetical protein